MHPFSHDTDHIIHSACNSAQATSLFLQALICITWPLLIAYATCSFAQPNPPISAALDVMELDVSLK